MNYYIIGVDPGNNIALAFLDFDSKVEELITLSGSINDVIREIEKKGSPSIIATDVRPAPEFAIRLASYFNAKLFVPKESITENKKWELVRAYEHKERRRLCFDVHQRDALAAAILAYRANQNTIRSLLGVNVDQKNKLIHLVLQGHSKDAALNYLVHLIPKEPQSTAQTKLASKQSNNSDKLDRIFELEKENIQLKKRIEILEQEKMQLQKKLSDSNIKNSLELLKDKEITRLKNKIIILKNIIKRFYFYNQKIKRDIKKSKQETNSNSSEVKKNENINLKTLQKQPQAKNLKELDADILIKIIEDYRKKSLKSKMLNNSKR